MLSADEALQGAFIGGDLADSLGGRPFQCQTKVWQISRPRSVVFRLVALQAVGASPGSTHAVTHAAG